MIDNASRVQFMYCERGERAKGRERRTGGGGNKVRYITGEKRHLLVKTERRGRERKYDLHVGIVNLTKVRAHTVRSRARVRRTHTRTCSHAPAHANKHARARTHACIPHTHTYTLTSTGKHATKALVNWRILRILDAGIGNRRWRSARVRSGLDFLLFWISADVSPAARALPTRAGAWA